MGKVFLLIPMALDIWVNAAEELADRASRLKPNTGLPTSLDDTTLMKSTKGLGKQSTNFVYQDDPEIFTFKNKKFGGTTLDLVGKGKDLAVNSNERAIPKYWGGEGSPFRYNGFTGVWGQFGDRDEDFEKKRKAPARNRGLGKQSSKFVYQDDPEIFTFKNKKFGGTTLDLVGKGKDLAVNSNERAIPKYWGGEGSPFRYKGFSGVWGQFGDRDEDFDKKRKAPARNRGLGKQSTKFVYQDDPEIFTFKNKKFGGTTLDLVGKGKDLPINSNERAIPKYWGGEGSPFRYKGFTGLWGQFGDRDGDREQEQKKQRKR